MKYCNYCKVEIREDKERCTLCGNKLEEKAGESERIYPDIAPLYKSHIAIRILVFISIVIIVTSFAVNIIFPSDRNWPILLIFGLLSIWLGLIFVVQKRYHIAKKIVWQVIIVSLLSIFWDYKIGWRGWSLDYVIPIASVSAMIIMYVTAKIMRLSSRDYITYAFIDGLFGIIPIIFLFFDMVNVSYPSIISIGFSIISISAILIFEGKEIKKEIEKRMHI